MKPIWVLLVSAFLGSTIAGCDGGISQEPTAEQKATGTATDEFKAMMEKNAAKMKMKGKPKDTPPPATPEKK